MPLRIKPLELNRLHLMDCKIGLRRLPPGSVDHIFTDPPYVADQWEEAYGILAKAAPRILRPSGFCLTYAPQLRLPEIINMILDEGLLWYWIIPQLNLGKSTALVHQRNAICLHKPILVFQKPPERKTPLVFADVVRSLRQKAFHPWQQ